MKRDSKAFRLRFLRWKNGEKVYDNGRALPGLEDGKDENEFPFGDQWLKEVTIYPDSKKIKLMNNWLTNRGYVPNITGIEYSDKGVKLNTVGPSGPQRPQGLQIVSPEFDLLTMSDLVKPVMKKSANKLINQVGKIVQKDIPYDPTHFYRGVSKEAILDAERSGILKGKNFESPYFGLGKPEWHLGYVIEGSHGSGVDWVSADDPTKIIGSGTRGLNKPESLPVEAFPQYNGSTQVPADGFTYWKKYPIIGWRKKLFNIHFGGATYNTLKQKPGYEDGKESKWSNSTIGAAVAENPAIMTASGWKNKDGLWIQDPDVQTALLANSLANISMMSPTHPINATLSGAFRLLVPYVKFNPKLNLRKPNIRPNLTNLEVRLNLGTDLGKNKIIFNNLMSRDQLYNLAESKGEIYNIPNLTISANTNGLNALELEGLAARKAAAEFLEFDVMPRMRQMGHPNVNDFLYAPDVGDIRLLNVPKASTKVGGWNDGFTTYLVKANKSNPLDEIAVHEFEHQQRRNMGQSLVELSNPNTTVMLKARLLLEVVNGEPIVNYGYTPQEKEILNSAYKFSKDFLKHHPNIEQIAEMGATNRQMRYALSKRFGGIFGKELDDVIGKLDVEDIERLLEEGNSYSRSFLQSINEEISALKANSDMSHYAASKKVWDVYRPAIQRALMKVGMGAGVAYTGAKKTQRNKPLQTNK